MNNYYYLEIMEDEMDKVTEWACRVLLWIIVALVFAFACWGCTKTALKRIIVDPNGLISYTAFTNYEFLMKSSMQDAEVMIEDSQGYRHYAIGSREQWPDPNSIEAVGGAGGKLIKEIAPVVGWTVPAEPETYVAFWPPDEKGNTTLTKEEWENIVLNHKDGIVSDGAVVVGGGL